jgi:superfamily II DNA or RNA helicase
MTSPVRREAASTSPVEIHPSKRERSSPAEALREASPAPTDIGRVSIDGALTDVVDDAQENLSRKHMLDRIDALIVRLQQEGHTKLHDHQVDVLHDLAEFIGRPPIDEEGNLVTWGYVRLPTGSGKTVIFSTLAGVVSAPKEGEKTPKGLILVPKLDLADQTEGDIDEDGKERGLAAFAKGVSTSTYTGKKKSLEGDVVVMTYDSLRNAVKAGVVARDMFDYIVCDEAHKSLGKKTSEAIKSIAGNAPVIGFTATTDYENKSVSDLFPEEIHSADLREAIELGWLSPVRAIAIDTKVELGEVYGGSDFKDEELEVLITNDWRNKKAVDFARDFVADGQQGLISCVPGDNLAHARLMSKLLSECQVVDAKTGVLRNIRAIAVDGNMSPKERQEIYRQYEKGLIDVITYVELITEGWDSDAAQFLINLRPTSSPVNAIQRLGRILRRVPGKIATVIEFIDKTQRPLYTFWHAMGEDEIVQGRVYSSEEDAKEDSEESDNIKSPQRRPIFSDEVVSLIEEIDHRAVNEMVVEHKKTQRASKEDLVLRDVLREYRMSRKLFDGLVLKLEVEGIDVQVYNRIFDGSIRAAISKATLANIKEALEHHRPLRQDEVVLLARFREKYNVSSEKLLEIAKEAGVATHKRNIITAQGSYSTSTLALYIDPADADRLDDACSQYIANRHEQLRKGGEIREFGSYDVKRKDMHIVLGITERQLALFLASIDPGLHPQLALDTTHPTKPFQYYPKSELAKLLKSYVAINGYSEAMLAEPYVVRNQIVSRSPRDRISPDEVIQFAEAHPRLKKFTVLVGPKGNQTRRVPKLFMKEFCDEVIKIRNNR